MLSISEIQKTLLDWMSKEDSRWTIWTGKDPVIAVQLFNIDNSNVYTRQVGISQELMAYDPNINVTTEIYKVTWIPAIASQEPDANAQWWISSDDGATKEKVTFVNKKALVKRSCWTVLLKKL